MAERIDQWKGRQRGRVMSHNPRRILMTADTIGGVWSYAIDLVRGLQAYGVEVAVATMGARPTPEQRDQIGRLPNTTLFESGYKLEWMNDPWEDVASAGEWLLEIERAFGPDCIHLNGYAHAALNWRAPHLVVAHSCVLSWWEAVRGTSLPPEWSRYRQEVRRGLRAADTVVAPTRAMLSSLHTHYGNFEHGRVIPNGRSADSYSIGDKQPFILSAGRVWDKAKNVSALEAAAPGLEWPVLIAGETRHPDGGGVEGSNLKLLGSLAPETLSTLMASASIFALPARYEPFGLSILEAALSGCALVIGDIPSLRENWDGAAEFVQPDDADQLRRTLNALIEDPARRREIAKRSELRALEFMPSRMVAGYLSTYAWLLREFAGRKEQMTACAS